MKTQQEIEELANEYSKSYIFETPVTVAKLAFIQGFKARDEMEIERINKYARHQFICGTLCLSLISFQECSETPPKTEKE